MRHGRMKVKALGCILIIVFLLGPPIVCFAGMESESYRITTSTLSGGGGAMGSANYQMNSTLGQPSPLMDSADPPWSESYWLFPGLWYTVDLGLGCYYDLDEDGDVDGVDLADFAAGFEADELAFFAGEFGRHDCGAISP
jgi:hypothetical protein